MANTLYHQLSSGEWMNISCPGGPRYYAVKFNDSDQQFYPAFSYDENSWDYVGLGVATAAIAQAQLNTFVGNINSGNVGP